MFGIDNAISAISNLADSAIKRIWPDATELEKARAAQLAAELQAEYKLLLGQLKVNEIEAASTDNFRAGWRPFVGWTCGVALAYAAIFEPIARFIAQVGFGYLGVFPVLDTDITMQILLGLLGLAGMRSFEKKSGIK